MLNRKGRYYRYKGYSIAAKDEFQCGVVSLFNWSCSRLAGHKGDCIACTFCEETGRPDSIVDQFCSTIELEEI
jgi:hypothetical protein